MHRLLAAGAALALTAAAPAFRIADARITEASGLAFGLRSPGIAYVQNDSGDTNRFFALDARTGKPRWRYDVGGPIPGTATVIGHTVYTSSFKTRETTGLDARTGKPVFHIKQAGYTPMVSDGKRLFLVGYYDLIGLEPRRR